WCWRGCRQARRGSWGKSPCRAAKGSSSPPTSRRARWWARRSRGRRASRKGLHIARLPEPRGCSFPPEIGIVLVSGPLIGSPEKAIIALSLRFSRGFAPRRVRKSRKVQKGAKPPRRKEENSKIVERGRRVIALLPLSTVLLRSSFAALRLCVRYS